MTAAAVAVDDGVRPFVLGWRDIRRWLSGRVGSDPGYGLDSAVGYGFDEVVVVALFWSA